MTEWWSWPLVVGAVLSVLSAVWAFLNRKGTERHEKRTLRPPTWPEVWSRMENQDARIEAQDEKLEQQAQDIGALQQRFSDQTNAIKRLLRSIAVQWPKGFPPPVLDQHDVDALGDTMPRQWLARDDEDSAFG